MTGEPHLALLLAGVAANAAPLVLAVMGETLTERGGLINLSLDGTILLAAMAAFATTTETGNLLLGFGAAAAVGAVVAVVVGTASVVLKQSQLAVGFVLALMCRDLAYFLGNPYARLHGLEVAPLPLPLLADIPFLGPALFRHNMVVYGAFAVIGLTAWYLYGTRWGLELRAVGENPRAASARGIPAGRVQLLHAFAGGALAGLAGGAYSLCIKPGWGHPQGAEGMGWIALAIVIFGGWHPVKAALGAYLFGTLQVLAVSLQNFWPSVPAQVFQGAPFPLMIVVLLLMNLSQREGAERWTRKHPRASAFLRFFRGNAPRGLGKSLT